MRSENIPPGVRNGHPGHHASRSQEERRRMMRYGGKPSAPPDALNIFADPTEQSRKPRMRRNSESSIASRMANPEEEARRQRRKEREIRHRDGKGRPPGAAGAKSKKPGQRLDLIDSLDVTSIYGTGCQCSLIHRSFLVPQADYF